MVTSVFPKVDAFMEVRDNNLNIVLLGVGGYAYVRRVTHYESLWKYPHTRTDDSIVYNKAKYVGGSQCFKVKNYKGNLVTICL